MCNSARPSSETVRVNGPSWTSPELAGEHGPPAAGEQQAAAELGGTAAELAALPGRVQAAGAAPAGQAAAADARTYADGLRPDQAAAVYGILTSGRPVDILVCPAGTGKPRTMGALADMWLMLTGGRTRLQSVMPAVPGQARPSRYGACHARDARPGCPTAPHTPASALRSRVSGTGSSHEEPSAAVHT